MWNFFIALALNFVSAALTARAIKPQKMQAGKLEAPKASEGDFIPIVLGTILVKESTVYYVGGQRAIAVRKKGGKK